MGKLRQEPFAAWKVNTSDPIIEPMISKTDVQWWGNSKSEDDLNAAIEKLA